MFVDALILEFALFLHILENCICFISFAVTRCLYVNVNINS